jgi:hypothetical protein
MVKPIVFIRFSFHAGRFFLLLVLLLVWNVAGLSQSGRRAPRPAPSPDIETPTTKEVVEQSKPPLVSLVVGTDSSSGLVYIPSYLYGVVLDGCVGRLRESRSLNVSGTGPLPRGDAIKRAKSEKQTYVLWLELRGDNEGFSDTGVDPSELAIRYYLYAPVTAKVLNQGDVWQGRRTGPITRSPTSNNRIYVEARLKESAREVADRVLKALQLSTTRP